MKILTICPSIYPDKLSRMLDSYYATVSCANLIINSDKNRTVTQVFNDMFKKYPDFDFYHMTNDDVVYKTKNWDIQLAQKGKISYGNDYLQGENLCTFPMIDGDIVRSIGWLQMPTLNRFCGDVTWKFIGEQLGILNYVPLVEIDHKWEGCADLAVNEADMEAFANWIPYSFKDIEKIKKVLNG